MLILSPNLHHFPRNHLTALLLCSVRRYAPLQP
jgi:hypothetical protein